MKTLGTILGAILTFTFVVFGLYLLSKEQNMMYKLEEKNDIKNIHYHQVHSTDSFYSNKDFEINNDEIKSLLENKTLEIYKYRSINHISFMNENNKYDIYHTVGKPYEQEEKINIYVHDYSGKILNKNVLIRDKEFINYIKQFLK